MPPETEWNCHISIHEYGGPGDHDGTSIYLRYYADEAARADWVRRLVIYGRAAIASGFADAPPEASRSLDVDVIIPVAETEELRDDIGFWEAQEAANRELQNLWQSKPNRVTCSRR